MSALRVAGTSGGMELHEAYQRLGLTPLWEYEREVLARNRTLKQNFPEGAWEDEGKWRRSGTTDQTLVEMYLDHEQARKAAGLGNAHKVKMLFVCLNVAQGKELRERLAHIHANLSLDVDVRQVTFFPHDGPPSRVRGVLHYSWGVFCDHAVKKIHHQKDRLLMPCRQVRSIRIGPDRNYGAYDREGELLCRLPRSGAHDLINRSSCPITLQTSDTAPSTTYASWGRQDLDPFIRLKKAWEL